MSSDPPKNYVSLMNNLKLDEVGHANQQTFFVPAPTEPDIDKSILSGG